MGRGGGVRAKEAGKRGTRLPAEVPSIHRDHSLQPHGILQARILEWAAFPFSRVSSQPRDRTRVSRVEGRFFFVCLFIFLPLPSELWDGSHLALELFPHWQWICPAHAGRFFTS